MNAKIIRSREEFEEFYYYKEAPAKEYPTRYPCVVTKRHWIGGLGSGGTVHEIYYPEPAGIDIWLQGFELGVKAGLEHAYD